MPEPAPPVVVHQNGVVAMAGGIVDSIKTLPPVLLLIVLLNMSFAGAAGWYLTGIENKRSEAIRLILDRCIPQAPSYERREREGGERP